MICNASRRGRVYRYRVPRDWAVDPKHDRYVRQAEACLRVAERALDQETRDKWILLAAKWLDMVPTDGLAPPPGALTNPVQLDTKPASD
jgi:hypothetical protein